MNTIIKNVKSSEPAGEIQFSESMTEEIPSTSICLKDCSNKHQASPLKTKSKTLRSENQEDVHSSSTPVTPRSKLSKGQVDSPCGSSLASAYYLGDGSQDLPEIIWDYSSPKNTKDIKDERPITIEDLLENLEYGTKGKSNATKTSTNTELYDKWMKVRNHSSFTASVEQTPVRKRLPKKSRRELMEELKTVLDSFKGPDASSNSNDSSDKIAYTADEDKSKLQQQVKSDCASENGSLDSSDEMWDTSKVDDDDFLIVKATQEFESCLISSQTNLNAKSVDQVCAFASTVPESSERSMKMDSLLRNFDSNGFVLKRETTESCFEKPQLSNCVKNNSDDMVFEKTDSIVNENSTDSAWDPEFDSDWDDILVSETISQIPDDMLLGKVNNPIEVLKTCDNNDFASLDSKTELLNHKTDRVGNKMHGCDSMVSCCIDFSKANKRTTTSSEELFQESDSDPFSDDLGLNEQEMFTLLDRMESQSISKCTPEEIAQKKENALKRLRHNQRQNQ